MMANKMIVKKFDQVAMPVSQIFQIGEIVVGNFLPWVGRVAGINDVSQEVLFVEASSEEASARIKKVFAHQREESLQALADEFSLNYIVLARAAKDGRLEARKSGRIWLASRQAVEKAIISGKIRPKNKEMK